MKMHLTRSLALALTLCYLAACGSATTMDPLRVHSAADMRALSVKPDQVYVIKFVDGTEQQVEGGVIFLEQDSLCVYSPNEGGWKRYGRAQIDEVYLENTDKVKQNRNRTLITGAAVLTAFVAAAAGGYFIEKNVR